MKKIFFLFLLALILTGCSNDEAFSDFDTSNENLASKNANVSPNVKAIRRYITRQHGNTSRSAEECMIPYIVNGDTVMYIANYGEGWDVFSNDARVPMLLMKSDVGSFYPTIADHQSPFEELFQNTAQYLSVLKKSEFAPTDTINTEWAVYGIRPMATNDENDVDPVVNYYWKWLGSTEEKSYHYEYKPEGGRLKTKWGQSTAFNQFTPYISGNHTPVGCVAVALGQYFYFTHYKNNCPETTVTNAYYNKSSNEYSFSGASSDIWDSFALEYNGINSTMTSTALFLGWIGTEIDMDYDEDGSSTSLIGKKTVTFFKNQTHLNASAIQFSKFSATEMLRKGYPVILRASHDNEKEGHAFIIDFYKSDETIYQDYYVYLPQSYGSGSIDEDESEDEEDPSLNLNEEYIREKYGDVEIRIETNYIYRKSLFKCNWGHGGKYNDDVFDAIILSWTVGGTNYNNKYYMYNF